MSLGLSVHWTLPGPHHLPASPQLVGLKSTLLLLPPSVPLWVTFLLAALDSCRLSAPIWILPLSAPPWALSPSTPPWLLLPSTPRWPASLPVSSSMPAPRPPSEPPPSLSQSNCYAVCFRFHGLLVASLSYPLSFVPFSRSSFVTMVFD